MNKLIPGLLAAVTLTITTQMATHAQGHHADRVAARHALTMPWHGPYYHTGWGTPIALIVPPTAQMQVNWGWGVSQSSMTPIYHQFRRRYPEGYATDGYPFSATPHWPSHTSQFGVYYVRGPY
jgi:hypothetical protein